MPFPGFLAFWCFSLISQRTSIKESQCLCAPLTHCPPETWSPLQLTLPVRQRSWELLSTSSRKNCCCVSTSTKESCRASSAPAKFPAMPLGQSSQECPAMGKGHGEGISKGCPSRKPGSSSSPACVCSSSLSQLLWPNRFWNLPNDVCQRVSLTN